MKTRGFTILELIIVIVILGILVTLGINNYTSVIEKSRSMEARQHLGAIRLAEIVYYEGNGVYTNNFDTLTVSKHENGEEPVYAQAEGILSSLIPSAYAVPTPPPPPQGLLSACNPAHFFRYDVTSSGTAIASRCTTNDASQGKHPIAPNKSYNITLTIDGVWGGTPGYY